MNNTKNISFSLLALVALMILPGCNKQRRKPIKKLKPLVTHKADYQNTQRDITLKTKLLSKEEYKTLLRKKRLNGFNRKVKAIQLSVTNNSKESWMLKPASINLEQISYRKMERQVIRYASWNGVGAGFKIALIGGAIASAGAACIYYIAGAGFFAPWLLPIVVLESPEIPMTTAGVIVATGIGVTAASPVVAIKKATTTAELNAQNKERLQKMMLIKPIIIKPNATKTRIIFVRKRDYEAEFEVGLTNVENKKEQLYFSVDLEPQYN